MSKNSPGQPRQPEGATTGGQFAAHTRPDSDIALTTGARTTYGGYDLRGFRTVGQGMEGRIWSGTIYKDGKAVLTVLEEGNGGQMRFTDKKNGRAHYGAELDAFRAVAAKFHTEGCEPEGEFSETLMFSAELDKLGRKHQLTRAEVVDFHVKEGVIEADERELFANPDNFLS